MARSLPTRTGSPEAARECVLPLVTLLLTKLGHRPGHPGTLGEEGVRLIDGGGARRPKCHQAPVGVAAMIPQVLLAQRTLSLRVLPFPGNHVQECIFSMHLVA